MKNLRSRILDDGALYLNVRGQALTIPERQIPQLARALTKYRLGERTSFTERINANETRILWKHKSLRVTNNEIAGIHNIVSRAAIGIQEKIYE